MVRGGEEMMREGEAGAGRVKGFDG
jgi:hypothetical protein